MDNIKTGFRIKGWVEDVSPVLSKARLNLVPLRFGAGIKGKLLDSFRNGTPSITPSIGAEGIVNSRQLAILARDEPDRFSKLAIELYSNQHKWNEIRKLGIDLINEHFNKVTFEEKLHRKITDLYHHLNQHRALNIVGSILAHQSMQSTKYLSKWIEAKNKAQL